MAEAGGGPKYWLGCVCGEPALYGECIGAYGELLKGEVYGDGGWGETRWRFAGGMPLMVGDMALGDCWYEGGEKGRAGCCCCCCGG